MKNLFLLDAYALIYRAYYALIRAPRMGNKGFNAAAVYGFCNTLDEVLRKYRPSHIAVCFDPKGGSTFRNELYPEYKANRQAQPEDITLAIPYIKEIIKAYNIQIIEVEGYEADDIIGTLAMRAERDGYLTYMMTPDKDYGQLVRDRILMLRPSNGGKEAEIRGPKEICEKYGINRPEQVVDLLALEGDKSDNIPGCPGVGEVTAAKLIRQWDNINNLIAHADELTGSMKKKILENADNIRLSYDLATIRTNVPLDIDISQLETKPEDVARLREIFTDLDFKSLVSRLERSNVRPNTPSPAPRETIDTMSLFDLPAADGEIVGIAPEIETVRLTEPEEVRRLVESLRKETEIGLSVYAVGDNVISASTVGIALASSKSSAHFVYLPPAEEKRAELLEALRPLFAPKSHDAQSLFDNSAPVLVSHDFKKDYILLTRAGIEVGAPYYDTSVAHYVLQPEMRHGFADVVMSMLGMSVTSPTVKAKQQFPRYNEAEAMAVFGEQASLSLELKNILTEDLKRNNLEPLYRDIELPFIKVLGDMEMTGVRIDTAELSTLSAQLTERLEEKEKRVYELAGTTFNIGSPTQVGEILFGQMKIDPKAKKTRKGSYSTTEEILEKFRGEYEIVDLILQIRGLKKLLATYINALPELINPQTEKIHTTYNQTVTATGRISSVNPNLQNIPIRTDDGREIRRAFIPDPGCLFLSADYSQIELRLMAHLSRDKVMIDAFLSGDDIHRATAAKIFEVSPAEVTDHQRRQAKTANFGIIYGISQFGLAERLGIPRAEAKALIEGYFNTYPQIREYISDAVDNARSEGFVKTLMGRKRYLPDINSRNATVRAYAERNAVNAPIQGTAADIIKIAMNRIHAAISREHLRSRMIMQVHDELCFNVIPDELETLKTIIVREMESAVSLSVRLEVSVGVGQNWLEAH